MGMGAEEDVYLPAVGEVLGVGDLLSIGCGLILLADLGVRWTDLWTPPAGSGAG